MSAQNEYANDTIWHFTLREMQSFATNTKFWLAIVGLTVALTISGPFATLSSFEVVPRFAYWGAICIFTFFANVAVALPVARYSEAFQLPQLAKWFAGGLAGSVAVALVVWFIGAFVAGISEPTIGEFMFLWSRCAPISIGITMAHLAFSKREPANAQTLPSQHIEPAFFKRLPAHLGKQIYALQAQDHYVEVTTARGREMILIRLEDAIAELEPIDGMRVHRSWWVAKDAIKTLTRSNGRLALRLKNGLDVPISRTHAKQAREMFAQK